MSIKSQKWAEGFKNSWEWVDVCNRVWKRLKRLRTVFKNVKKGRKWAKMGEKYVKVCDRSQKRKWVFGNTFRSSERVDRNWECLKARSRCWKNGEMVSNEGRGQKWEYGFENGCWVAKTAGKARRRWNASTMSKLKKYVFLKTQKNLKSTQLLNNNSVRLVFKRGRVYWKV